MYKFVVSKGSCGSPYDVEKSEASANEMERQGFELVQVYQIRQPVAVGQNQYWSWCFVVQTHDPVT